MNLRQIVNAIFYGSRTGCPREMLPKDFPPKSTVYECYRDWQRDGTWERVHDALREKVRIQDGRKPEATAGIVDSQSVKTTETRGERVDDAGKKIKGRKRHLLVDIMGLIMAVVLTTASVQDRDGAKLVFRKAADQSQLKLVWANGG